MTSLEYARRFLRIRIGQLALTLTVALPSLASAAHITDGIFTTPTEWTGPNVNKHFFDPAAGGSGNAWLYAEQSGGILFLMYDYVGNTAQQNSNSFFNVFFQVGDTDYGVHMTPNGFTTFEKPVNILSPLNPDGSFNFNTSPWTAVSPADLALANFHAQLAMGTSVNLGTPHWMAEFDVTINTTKNGPQNGLYSPNPAFWSASTGGGFNAASLASDPPISSAIFTLDPGGNTITILPDLRNGAPILEDSAIPEPATAWMFGSGALVLLVLRWKRSVAHRSNNA